MTRSTLLPVSGLLFSLLACSAETTNTGGSSVLDGGTPLDAGTHIVVPAKLALVTDWINGSLSYVDVDAVLDGGTTRASLVTSTLDLSAYPPGPIDVAITPDKKTAFVSSSTGFFAIPLAGVLINASNLPTGPGKLLMIDIATGKVSAELDSGLSPMSIQITPDGKRAVLTNFGSGNLSAGDGTLAVVDVESKTVTDRISVGTFPEELAFDETGTVAIFGVGTAGSLRTFAVADPRNMMSPEISLQGDSAGVAFFPGTKIAFGAQAPSVLSALSGGMAKGGYTVVDVSSPTAPVVLEDVRLDDDSIGYPVVAAKNRGSVLVPVTTSGRLVLREYKLIDRKASLTGTIDIADATLLAALGIAYDGDHTALLAWPSQRSLVVVDLATQRSRVIPWLAGQPGPADVTFR